MKKLYWITLIVVALLALIWCGQNWFIPDNITPYVVPQHKGVSFEMAGITDEYAMGIQAGLDMSGLFRRTEAINKGNSEWEFTGEFKKEVSE